MVLPNQQLIIHKVLTKLLLLRQYLQVNVNVYLKTNMMDINGQFVWTLGSVIREIQLISTLKKLFVLYLSVTWMTTHSIQGNNRIHTITRITWITRFLFISCLDQFCLYFPKSIVNGIARKHRWQKSWTYIRNQTYKRLVWMAAPISYSMALSIGSPKFICLCINFLHYLNQRIIDPFSQTNTP